MLAPCQVHEVLLALPSHMRNCKLKLQYSGELHGFSFYMMYHRCTEARFHGKSHDFMDPVLMLIRTLSGPNSVSVRRVVLRMLSTIISTTR